MLSGTLSRGRCAARSANASEPVALMPPAAAARAAPASDLRVCASGLRPAGVQQHPPAVSARGARRQAVVTRAGTSGSASTSAKAVAPAAPYNLVITGSTKGIGRALAEGFLAAGDRVVICARSADRVDEAVAELAARFGADKVKGVAVDVSKPGQARVLADFAVAELGRVDMWINNAGTNAYRYGPLAESDDEELQQIVSTNVLGVMLCCKEAIRVMRTQSTHGHIFNMDGAGADGNATPRFAAYGATKRSLAQLAKSLTSELGMLGVKNVAVHNLSPGMVTTELLMAGANTPTAKFFINALAEPAQEAAAFLVPRVRAVPSTSVNPLTGGLAPTYIRFLTQGKALQQVLSRLLTGARKSRYVAEDGDASATHTYTGEPLTAGSGAPATGTTSSKSA